ncbi:MAG: thiamine pyrophosphate-binding protein [Anaerolineae bacterium]|nr:thiamine pyrophosphate-binding protein [Anaerolineae bacterium]NIN97053.1 thiamine pyrophosphate-binding protein [Anaerolineae bacterium]NIQ80002.1 thiamine pyrophosphate-binding protein [Anaerolineae bacterium]
MKVAEAIVRLLEAYGVEYIFGVPGDTSMPFYDALYDAPGDVKHILARDERSASFMADVYARLSFKPGVCEGPSGGGATYIVPGVAEAHASSIPLMVLTSDTPLSGDDKGVLTELDQEALFGPVTKWCTRIKKAENTPEIMARAFRIATSGRPGAVQITLPHDVLDEDLETFELHAEQQCAAYPAYRTRPDPQAVERATTLLLEAQRPVMIAGGGAVISQAWNEITELAQALTMPVGTSINGKGSIAETHQLSIGVVGGNGARPYANRVVSAADLVLFVGCKTDSVTTVNWTVPSAASGVTIIHVDVDPKEIGNNYPTAVGMVGDAKLALSDLLDAVKARVQGREADEARLEGISKEAELWWQSAEAKMLSDSIPIKPQRVMKELIDALPVDSVIVADAGTGTPFTSAFYESPAGRYVVIPRGYGGLGYAIPGVVGAKVARPEATVVGLMGDGSFGMSAGELETIARLQLPVTILQFNNSCFGWIKALQALYYDGRYVSVDFSPDTDHASIAQGFGLLGVRVDRPQALGPAIRRAIQSDKPTFIDVITESEETELPPVHKWQQTAEERDAKR